jgi:hypothetical protein
MENEFQTIADVWPAHGGNSAVLVYGVRGPLGVVMVTFHTGWLAEGMSGIAVMGGGVYFHRSTDPGDDLCWSHHTGCEFLKGECWHSCVSSLMADTLLKKLRSEGLQPVLTDLIALYRDEFPQ